MRLPSGANSALSTPSVCPGGWRAVCRRGPTAAPSRPWRRSGCGPRRARTARSKPGRCGPQAWRAACRRGPTEDEVDAELDCEKNSRRWQPACSHCAAVKNGVNRASHFCPQVTKSEGVSVSASSRRHAGERKAFAHCLKSMASAALPSGSPLSPLRARCGRVAGLDNGVFQTGATQRRWRWHRGQPAVCRLAKIRCGVRIARVAEFCLASASFVAAQRVLSLCLSSLSSAEGGLNGSPFPSGGTG
jgi:hypothetical protein